MSRHSPLRITLVAIAAMAVVPSSHAGNGMYLIGYGTESALMGGADVAVARDAFAANNNPAGMMQIERRALDVEVAPFYNWGTNHTDTFGSFRKPFTNGTSMYANGAYAQRIEDTPYAVGAALVVQGGVGWVYSGMNTVFGARDDASSMFTIVKLAPAFAWQVNERWRLGASLGINYLAGTQELFPNTSNAAFQGFRFNGASGFGITTRWGLQYKPADDVIFGFTYGTPTSIPLKQGCLRINRSDIGLGTVRYDNAELEGFRLPEEFAFGVAFRPTAPLLVSLQTKWYNWSQALHTTRLTARDPRDPAAPGTVFLPGTIDAMNQTVVEFGLAYDYDDDNTLYAGYNHGNRIIPDSNMSPTFALIYNSHVTGGIRHKFGDEWLGTGGFELYPPKTFTYDSPLFGARATERHNGLVVHLQLGRRW